MIATARDQMPRRSGLVTRLADAIRTHVAPGMHLHFASTPSRSNAAILEIARLFLTARPGFRLSCTGFHSTAHLLAMLGLADRLTACFFGDHYPAPRPNALYSRLAATGVTLDHWPLWSMIASFRAGAQGDDWVVNRSLHGTSIAKELLARGDYRELTLPHVEAAGRPVSEPRPLGLCAALRPDITFVHAAAADDDGHVILASPLSEGPWSALAARRGVIVTVEQLVTTAVTRAHAGAIVIPPHRVLAVCEEPFGAHPQPMICPSDLAIAPYRDDFEGYEGWRALTADAGRFAAFVDRVLRTDDAASAYRAEVGAARFAELEVRDPGSPANPPASPEARLTAATRRHVDLAVGPPTEQPRPAARAVEVPTSRDRAPPIDPTRAGPRFAASVIAVPDPADSSTQVDVPGGPPVDQLIVGGARQLVERARAIDARVLIAGIGHAFFAARLAQLQLAATGFPLRVMVETGLYDVDCGPEGHGYLLAYDNWIRARRLTAIDDILGALACGADNRCIAALGAAQVDRHGNLNSTRLGHRVLVGSGGACDIAASAEEVVVLTRAAPGRLVDKVEYITSPGRAVRSVVTEHGVLTRPDVASTTWTIASLTRAPAAGETVELGVAAVQRACPWRLVPATGLAYAPITDQEARLLHALDPHGKYRRRAG